MKLLLLTLLTTIPLFAMSGCETEGAEHTASQSAIPWNKPASWEGAGALGAMGMGSH
ncbi:MAG: hypothetical protein K2W97_07245 [Chthoniobacterales bacterium]|nr:hypothetical protein [Chthoniobacterales bacterium]